MWQAVKNNQKLNQNSFQDRIKALTTLEIHQITNAF